ncbi:ABC transporter ATP-binding protein [Prosthecobacter sp.]|uniref:ABC transporter ATP-binding protein n=1 Tax=Prosthecobacter sp. TaxID=1965333 RepID=UPI003782EF22
MVTITIQELTKRFSGSVVLSSVDLQIAAGELFFLLGPSGCGKTTLLRHIAGFYTPDAGKIWFDDQDVTRLPAHKRATGMMFQNYALWPHLNVAQNVAFGLEERKRPRREIEHRVSEALEQVKLDGLGTRKIQQLSGGQQQRVALARALVIRPKCLLLDEPLSNLDAKLRLEMRTEIRQICKENGLTAIYVTHDRDEALSMADRMAIMDAGKLIQVGAPPEIYLNPATRMVAEFIGETNFIEGRTLRESSREGFYDIETTFGVLRGRTNDETWQPASGQPVMLSIRPEALTFGSVLDSPNRFPGKIIDTTYLGAMVQYRIQVQNGPLMKVCEINPMELRLPGEAEVRVMAAMGDVVILRK